jgi:hypothetical protein
MSPLSISTSLRSALLTKLDAYRAQSTSTPDQGTTNGHGSTDSEQVLTAVLSSSKTESEDQVEKAVDEYIGGKPLAYITGEPKKALIVIYIIDADQSLLGTFTSCCILYSFILVT